MDSQLSCKFKLIDLARGFISERGVNTLAVVEPLNVVENTLPCLGASQIAVVKNVFSFQKAEKALCRRVVPAVAFAAHTANSTVFCQ